MDGHALEVNSHMPIGTTASFWSLCSGPNHRFCCHSCFGQAVWGKWRCRVSYETFSNVDKLVV